MQQLRFSYNTLKIKDMSNTKSKFRNEIFESLSARNALYLQNSLQKNFSIAHTGDCRKHIHQLFFAR